MKKQDSHKPDDPEQSRRFEEKARELDADKSAKAFERAMGVIAKKPAKKADKKAGNASV